MKRALLGAAVIAAAPFALASPAPAQSFVAASITASSGVRDSGVVTTRAYAVHIHRGSAGYSSDFRDRSRRGRHGDGRDYAFGYAPGYYDPGDYDANRSFDPDKWNDWWHERPERSFPRWVWRNRDCTEDRMWWSGAGWRCTP